MKLTEGMVLVIKEDVKVGDSSGGRVFRKHFEEDRHRAFIVSACSDDVFIAHALDSGKQPFRGEILPIEFAEKATKEHKMQLIEGYIARTITKRHMDNILT